MFTLKKKTAEFGDKNNNIVYFFCDLWDIEMTAEKCAKTWERVCEKSMWCWQLIKLRLNQQYFQSQFCCCWCRLFYYLFRAFKELFFIHIWEGLYVPHAHNCTNKYTFWQDNSMHEYAQAERKTRLEITGAINLYIYICIATYSEWDIEGYNTRPNDCPAGVCVCVRVRAHIPPLWIHGSQSKCITLMTELPWFHAQSSGTWHLYQRSPLHSGRGETQKTIALVDWWISSNSTWISSSVHWVGWGGGCNEKQRKNPKKTKMSKYNFPFHFQTLPWHWKQAKVIKTQLKADYYQAKSERSS